MSGLALQRPEVESVTDLYRDACMVRPEFKEGMVALAKRTFTYVDFSATVKPILRVVEKMALRGSAANTICDVNTCTIICDTMSRVADVVTDFSMCMELIVVGVEEHFVSQPLTNGWREMVIYFNVASDPYKHVCEARVSRSPGRLTPSPLFSRPPSLYTYPQYCPDALPFLVPTPYSSLLTHYPPTSVQDRPCLVGDGDGG